MSVGLRSGAGSDSEGENDWKEGDKDDSGDENYAKAFFASL